jgi:hypothetical protein
MATEARYVCCFFSRQEAAQEEALSFIGFPFAVGSKNLILKVSFHSFFSEC